MYHTPLTWYEQENLGHAAYFEAFPQSTVVFASAVVEVESQRHCASVLQTGTRVHKTQRFLNSLSDSVCGHTGMCCYRGMLHDTVFLLLTRVTFLAKLMY